MQLQRYNGHISIGPFAIYLRVTQRAIGRSIKRTVDIASINSKQHTGKFQSLLEYIEQSARSNGLDGVYIESILNEWLPDKLADYGYIFVNTESGVNMYKGD